MKRLTSEVTARAGWLRDCGLFAGLDDADLAAVAEVCGNPGYIVPYAIALLCAFVGMHALWARVRVRVRRDA